MLEVKKMTSGYGKKVTLKDVDLSFHEGEIVCLFGPNGVGKTTFFKSVLGFIKLLDGEVLLNNKPMEKLSKKEIAKEIAYVPQAHNAPFDFSVFDVVLMGRSVHLKGNAMPTNRDREIVKETLKELKIEYLKHQSFRRISGGERQMVLIARALVQETKIIVLDEPTSNLDYGNEIKIINQVKKLREKNMLVIMTTHSPNQVLSCGTRVVVFKDQGLYATGKPEDIITEKLLKNIYEVKTKVYNIIDDNINFCVPCNG
jgi:iron complex transport system ATP-binding protein